MNLHEVDPFPMSERDSSTVYAAATPPETVADFLDEQDPLSGAKQMSSSVPWPGSTFIIRSAISGQVLTLDAGEIILASPGGPGSIHWTCIDTKGWLGFRNTVSGKFLGHNGKDKMHCNAGRHLEWEEFCARMTPEGGYILLMPHWEQLWPIGLKNIGGAERLSKIPSGSSEVVTWEFFKV